MEAASKENKVWHSVSTSSWRLNKDRVCTFKNTSQQVYDMAFDKMLAIFFYNICAALCGLSFSVVMVP